MMRMLLVVNLGEGEMGYEGAAEGGRGQECGDGGSWLNIECIGNDATKDICWNCC
jgi:hypothetical protein